MKIELIKIKRIDAEGMGSLSFFEAEKDVDFKIKRIYYIYDVPARVERGGHAHKKLNQILFCPYGKITIRLDDGREKEEILLDSPEIGLVIRNNIWREMIWEKDNSVLCVAASEYYDEADYIRNYSEFVDMVNVR